MSRKVSDCRKYPNSTCSLTIAGEEDEVMDAAVQHAVSKHGEKDSPQLRDEVFRKFEAELRAHFRAD